MATPALLTSPSRPALCLGLDQLRGGGDLTRVGDVEHQRRDALRAGLAQRLGVGLLAHAGEDPPTGRVQTQRRGAADAGRRSRDQNRPHARRLQTGAGGAPGVTWLAVIETARDDAERKQVTVLFADVSGSMDLAEQQDPEEWRKIMQRFFSILADAVTRFEGTVDKFTGDGIMAVFRGAGRP